MMLHFNLNILKKKKKTLLVFIVILFNNVLTFAQNSANIGDTADTIPLDTQAVPIKDYILGAVASAFILNNQNERKRRLAIKKLITQKKPSKLNLMVLKTIGFRLYSYYSSLEGFPIVAKIPPST
jgi:hypothetical protein